MTLLNSDKASEENAEAIADIPSHIIISLVSVIFCGFISLNDLFFVLFFAAIIGIIAAVYAVRTLIAKKNLDYENAIRYSQLAKIWTIVAYIFGVFLGVLSWFVQFI